MDIYLITLCSSLILYVFLKNFIHKNKFLLVFLSLLPLLIVSAIRYNVGWDYSGTYHDGFVMIGKRYNIHYFTEEPFNWLVRIIYDSSKGKNEWLFIICSIINFIILAKAISDQSINVPVSIMLIVMMRYYFLTLNIVRQGIAMVIFLFSIKYIRQRNFKKYFLSILFACCFHLMSIVYLPIYFICQLDYKKRKNVICILIWIILLFAGYSFMMLKTKYVYYIGSKYDDKQLLIHEVLLGFCVAFFAFLEYKNNNVDKEYYKIYFILNLIYFIVALMSPLLPVADRLCWLFYIANILFIPMILKNAKKKSDSAIIFLILFLLMGMTLFAQTIMGDSYSVIPYKTIFRK